MKIVHINLGNFGSTGAIMRKIADAAISLGHTVYLAYPCSDRNIQSTNYNTIHIGTKCTHFIIERLSIITGGEDYLNLITTWLFIMRLNKIQPDIVHLHNIHGYYINHGMLFKYLKRNNIKVVWTFHDCWPLTGGCTHFTNPLCNKWRSICYDCDRLRDYPMTWIDNTRRLHIKKKIFFSSIEDLTIATPSVWLSNLVKYSFFKEKQVAAVGNGVDIEIFNPKIRFLLTNKRCVSGVDLKSNKYIRLLAKDDNEFKIGSRLYQQLMALRLKKKILVAASTDWTEKKGLNDYVVLSQELSQDYQIVLIGVTNEQSERLPPNILCLPRVSRPEYMSFLYNLSDIALSLSYMESFGLTLIESNACGLPVIAYDNTAQSELVNTANGILVETGNLQEIKKAIRIMSDNINEVMERGCYKAAEKFAWSNVIEQYFKLYKL